ncbi:MAG: PGPGW domain-containing protein [Candidatus Nanopelagicales bacterium]
MPLQDPENAAKPTEVGKPGVPESAAPSAGEAAQGHETRREHLRDASTVALRKVTSKAPASVQERMHAFRERIRARRSLDTAWRILVFAVGVTLVAAGAIMFLIPGPGWATLILGLVVLASEFTWANRVLDPVKSAARRATDAAMDPRRRRRNMILAGVAGVLIGIAVVWYLVRYGVTVDPLMNLLQEITTWFTGLF